MSRKLVWIPIFLIGVYAIIEGTKIFSKTAQAPIVVYNNGVAEYSLIADNFSSSRVDKIRKWVLQFEDVYRCQNSGNNDFCNNFQPLIVEPYFESPPVYSPLVLSLKYPKMNFLKHGENIYGMNIIRTRIYKNHHAYHDISPITGRGHGFYTSYKNGYEVTCSKGDEIASGVYKLREPTKNEKDALVAKYPWTKNHQCLHSSSQGGILKDEANNTIMTVAGNPSVEFYALYNEDDKPVAYGSCNPTKNSAIPGNCSITMWLPLERTISLFFGYELIEKLPEIYSKITNLVIEWTVAEKSTNLD